jgi:5-formyltetrahydrofolate cyclo-ligase
MTVAPASDPDLDRRKAEARRRARQVRAEAEDPSAGAALILRLPQILFGRSPVAGYWPLGAEIDPRPLLVALLRAGAEVALPRMGERRGPPQFLQWQPGDRLTPDSFGILAPLPTARVLTPAVVFCPLLAFDRRGGRLGQGGGHYDRILRDLRPFGVVAMGLAYAAQELEQVPTGPLDAPLDWVLTEAEAIACVPL